jgi:hypothetical protein
MGRAVHEHRRDDSEDDMLLQSEGTQRFMLANDKRRTSGAAMHEERPEHVIGCRYSLQNNQTFELSSGDLR